MNANEFDFNTIIKEMGFEEDDFSAFRITEERIENMWNLSEEAWPGLERRARLSFIRARLLDETANRVLQVPQSHGSDEESFEEVKRVHDYFNGDLQAMRKFKSENTTAFYAIADGTITKSNEATNDSIETETESQEA
jgi:uncharacterized Fe-S cluster-containing radical SAM superfamily protein